MKQKMKKLHKSEMRLRSEIFYQIWEKYKGSYSMRELARILGVPITNFFKAIKSFKVEEVEESQKKCN